MFWGYFDESGTHDNSEVFAIAGYIGGEAQWGDFEHSWTQVLRLEGVQTFHMAPLSANPRRGPFKGWSDDRAECFLGRLFEVINAHELFGIAAFVRWSDFNDVLRPALVLPRDAAYKHPYIFCLQSCMSMLVEHWPRLPYSLSIRPITCVFDRNHEMRGKATEHFFHMVDIRGWEKQFHVIAFAPKHLVIPLQAADLLAYETYKYGTNAFRNPDEPRRKELTKLVEERRCLFNFVDRTTLTELAAKLEQSA